MDKAPQRPGGLSDLSPDFPFILCDLWGVLHNGQAAFPDAVDALVRHRQQGGHVVIVSNSPRLSRLVKAQIAGLGIGEAGYDRVITSGDLTRRRLETDFAGKTLFHLGPPADAATIEGPGMDKVGRPEAADVIVATGLLAETAEGHDDLLHPAAARQIPMLCANPDRVVQHGGALALCAGAVADRYERMGAPVHWLGKPAAPPYDACRALFAGMAGRHPESGQMLMIGDGLPTDISGAARQGIASLFIESGIHQAELEGGGPQALFAKFGVTPDFAAANLAW